MADFNLPAYTVRRSRRAKHLLLHVDLSGAVELVVPWHVSFDEGRKFVTQQADWLERTLRKKTWQRASVPRRRLITGDKLPVFGRWYELEVKCEEKRKRTRLRERPDGVLSLKVPGREEVRPALRRWYQEKAKSYFERQAQDFGIRLGVHVLKVVVSDARSQWGSCIEKNRRISLGWRLALAPHKVADYVVAHEVAHLREPGHGPSFWRLVAQVDGDFVVHRRWLKQHGHTLVL